MINTFDLILLLLLLQSIFLQSDTIDYLNISNTNATCNLKEDCDHCDFCGKISLDYSTCNFDNVFCKYTQDNNYEYNSALQDKYSNYFRSDLEINNFCGEKYYNLNSMKDTFTIFESKLNSINLSKPLHCDYIIDNKYYYNHETDKAELNFQIKNMTMTYKNNTDENNNIKFNLFLIYNIVDSVIFLNLTDDIIRNSKIFRRLDKIVELEVLIDFKNDINDTIDEYLEITIFTDNPSKKNRIMLIIAIVFTVFVALVIIILVILYIFFRKKLNIFRTSEDAMLEKQMKMEKNRELIKQLLENILFPKVFNKEIIVNDCENCSICLDSFEPEKSLVSITQCNHVFHYECIKEWIEKNVLNPLCPNCKYALLENLEKTEVINLKQRNNNKKNDDANNDKTNNDNNNNIMKNENNNDNNNIAIEIRNNDNINNGIGSNDNLNSNIIIIIIIQI